MSINVKEEMQIRKIIFDIEYGNSATQQMNDDNFYFDVLSSQLAIEKVTDILKAESSILDITVDSEKTNFVIVGDIHGDLASLFTIFNREGNPSKTRYLFLGDYVDRGSHSSEVLLILYCYKVLYPSQIYLIRGNHEFESMNDGYGFKSECESRNVLGTFFYEKITQTYAFLPLCAIINKKIFCVHGGISNFLESKDGLQKVRKVGKMLNSFNLIQTDFLWNDPQDGIENFAPSSRGIGSVFGKKALFEFLDKIECDVLIRGHQNQMDGYACNFGKDGRMLTVFSSVNYCDTGNEGAYAKVMKNNKIYCTKFNLLSNENCSKKCQCCNENGLYDCGKYLTFSIVE